MKKLTLAAAACAALVTGCNMGTEPVALNEGEVVSIVEVTPQTNDACRDWNANLKACKPYRCVYAGSNGAMLGREIMGMQNGKCAYREQLPGAKALQCALPQKNIQDMAKYYQMAEVSENVQLSVMQLADGTVVYQEVMNGQPVRTPLQKALSDKNCKIMALKKTNGNVEMTDLQFGQGKDTENIIL